MSKTILKNTRNQLVAKIVDEEDARILFSDGDAQISNDKIDGNERTPTGYIVTDIVLVTDSEVTVVRDPDGSATEEFVLPSSTAMRQATGDMIKDTTNQDQELAVQSGAGSRYTMILTVDKIYT